MDALLDGILDNVGPSTDVHLISNDVEAVVAKLRVDLAEGPVAPAAVFVDAALELCTIHAHLRAAPERHREQRALLRQQAVLARFLGREPPAKRQRLQGAGAGGAPPAPAGETDQEQAARLQLMANVAALAEAVVLQRVDLGECDEADEARELFWRLLLGLALQPPCASFARAQLAALQALRSAWYFWVEDLGELQAEDFSPLQLLPELLGAVSAHLERPEGCCQQVAAEAALLAFDTDMVPAFESRLLCRYLHATQQLLASPHLTGEQRGELLTAVAGLVAGLWHHYRRSSYCFAVEGCAPAAPASQAVAWPLALRAAPALLC
jgi:hypothetical protein